jgi:hypothetical protein
MDEKRDENIEGGGAMVEELPGHVVVWSGGPEFCALPRQLFAPLVYGVLP